ncbi:N-acetylmuramoyl-L-alanine amidase [Streptomyces vilmorinianum]|uniref:N-acetylmuramoyl-L-alanine amidase n=1 Tax=Streptomyces vilmorinianum TaxID=3051092 RepID=UPI0010FB7D49|nr:N-acetylmuramoyl-L-alanine amidase [Streptomyces vilmorinianum]
MPYDHRKDHRNTHRKILTLAGSLVACAALAGCGGTAGSAGTAGTAGTAGSVTPQRTADAKATGSPTPEPTPEPTRAQAARPLSGRTIVIDPGHNPGNFQHSREINQKVDIGTGRKECDTTGTSTDAGYTEAAFTLDVSHRLRDLLKAQGAKVVLTHDAERPFGPCIDERARTGNTARADAVVSVHADGSATGHRGFHVILPALVTSGSADTTKIVGPSRTLGEDIARHFARATGSAPANYLGSGTGLDVRKDLGGLNLSNVPKVFVECGNMRDPKDAALLTDAAWRQKAAQGIADGIGTYLKG